MLILSVTVLALAADQSIGVELCGRTNGSSTRDQATGSVLMAGATIVGASFNRDGTAFTTNPTFCGTLSQDSGQFPDCDNDGLVTLADYKCLSDCLGGPGGEVASESCKQFDMDGSGAVDLKDVRRFQNHFGSSIGG